MRPHKHGTAILLAISGLLLVGWLAQSAVAARSSGHVAWLPFVVGLVALVGAAFVSPARLVRAGPWLFGASLVVACVPVRYSSAGGEAMKIGAVAVLAWALGRQDEPRDARSAAGLLVVIVGALVPLVAAGDLGTAALVVLVGATMLAHEAFTPRAKALLATVHLVGIPLALRFGLHGYQRARLLGFLADQPETTSYQTVHAVRLVAAGGLFGHGAGTWAHAERYPLPGASDAFALAVWAYERGFVGLVAVVAIYAVLLFAMLRASDGAVEPGARRIVLGGAALLFWQAAWNAAMVLGMAPIVRMPLPFVSHGGASLLVSSFVVGTTLAGLRDRARERRRA